MPTLTRPGVYVDESSFPTFAAANIGTAVAAFVGWHPRGPVTPSVINSWQDFVSTYGGFDTAYPPSPLALAVFTYFSGGGTSAAVVRAYNHNAPPVGPALASASFNDADIPPTPTVTISANNVGAWGNNLYIDILPGTVTAAGVPQTFTLQVKYKGTGPANLVERWENLTMVPGSVFQGQINYVADVINSPYTGSRYIQVQDLFATAGVTNLLTTQESSFEDGATTTGWNAVANTTLSNFSLGAQALDGTYVMRLTATATGIMQAGTATGIGGTPVLPGKSYSVTGSFRAATTVSPTCSASILWFDAAGNLISQATGTNVADTTTGWTAGTLTATSPGNAAFAGIQLNVTAAAAGQVHYVDLVSFLGQNLTNNPATTNTSTPLTGGADGSLPTFPDNQAAIQSLDQYPDQPFVLNLPGLTTATDIGNAISYAENRGDVFVVVDCPPGLTPSGMVNFGNGLAASAQAAVYYPQLQISDPYSNQPGRTRLIPPGGYVVGTYVSTDSRRTVAKAPAGLGASLPGVFGLETVLGNNDLSNLTQANVNCIMTIPGAGVVVWGARTLSNFLTTRYVSVQRTLIYLQTQFIALTRFAVFEPNDYVLWSAVTSVLSQFLNSFWQSGGLQGATATEAFYVICDQTNNTANSIQSGIVNVSVGVALQRPAEFVVIQIGQWAGGQSVQVITAP